MACQFFIIFMGLYLIEVLFFYGVSHKNIRWVYSCGHILEHILYLTLTVCEIHPFESFGTFHLSVRNHCIRCGQKGRNAASEKEESETIQHC